SDSVFHSPQASHLPCQREYAAPQFWQTKEREDLAICDSTASVISARARACQDISLAMRLRSRRRVGKGALRRAQLCLRALEGGHAALCPPYSFSLWLWVPGRASLARDD